MNFIEIAGESYPISFGYGALMEYENLTGKSALVLMQKMERAGDNVGITECITLIACGLTNGSDEAGKPQQFTPKSIARTFDKIPPDEVGRVIAQAMEFLKNSFAVADEKKTVKMSPTIKKRRKTG